jgi:hypothetical protein
VCIVTGSTLTLLGQRRLRRSGRAEEGRFGSS